MGISKRFLTFHAISLIFISLIAIVLTEVGYRIYLNFVETSQQETLTFNAFSSSIWQYDEKAGYTYKPSHNMDWVMIIDGLPKRCGSTGTDSHGYVGRGMLPSQEGLEIAVLGDSFSSMAVDGSTWPDFFGDEIQRANQSLPLRIRNLSRDGYGVLQMIDQAAGMIASGAMHPDVILIAIIGQDLVRHRTWRIEKLKGRTAEVFYSFDPRLIESPETYNRAALINPKVTTRWCEELKVSGNRNDATLIELTAQYKSALAHDQIFDGKRVDLFSVTNCYFCNTLKWGTPYRRGGLGIRSSGGINFDKYSTDPAFTKGMETIKNAGIPVWLVYLPWEPELRNGKKELKPQEDKLLKELESYSDRFFDLTPTQPLGEKATALTLLPEDKHPSLDGLRYYGAKGARQIYPELLALSKLRLPRD